MSDHPPKRGRFYKRPKVHAGFLKAWGTNGLSERVMKRIKSIFETPGTPALQSASSSSFLSEAIVLKWRRGLPETRRALSCCLAGVKLKDMRVHLTGHSLGGRRFIHNIESSTIQLAQSFLSLIESHMLNSVGDCFCQEEIDFRTGVPQFYLLSSKPVSELHMTRVVKSLCRRSG